MNIESLVYPVWSGQAGPAMPLREVDQRPVIILAPDASDDQIAAAKAAIQAITACC